MKRVGVKESRSICDRKRRGLSVSRDEDEATDRRRRRIGQRLEGQSTTESEILRKTVKDQILDGFLCREAVQG